MSAGNGVTRGYGPGRLSEDLLVELDETSAEPLHRQIEAAIRSAVRQGRLAPGTSVPASRTLAADLGVSRGVVVEAYRQLGGEGVLMSTPGGYTRVAAATRDAGPWSARTTHPSTDIDFGYGRCDPGSFPRQVWLRSLRRVFTQTPHDRLAYPDGHGAPEFRQAMSAYLNRARGLQGHPDNVVACAGYAQAVNLSLGVLARRGATRIAVEDPCMDDDVLPTSRALGLEIVGIPVTDGGWDVAALAASRADVAVLTPSHQWPIGSVMSAGTRSAVVRWARKSGAYVIEDDYDAEFRYDRPAVGALQGRAPDRVIYVGSASKTLIPGLRLGWMVLPNDLVAEVADVKLLVDRGSPTIDQLAMADFVDRGELDRHLRKMRPVYQGRRDALVRALGSRLPGLRAAGTESGLHVVTWIPDGVDENAIVNAAGAAGVRIGTVGAYRRSPGRPGLIFGYSALTERRIEAGVDQLTAALRLAGLDAPLTTGPGVTRNQGMARSR
jgi:GntR family transcriptional regulator/MocR family aminotransferase